MSAHTAETPLDQPTPDRVIGYVDAIVDGRVFGWAWDPDRPRSRLSIELRAGDRLVASGRAERPRPDLAANGVGDGAYAFEFSIPEITHAEEVELKVFAIDASSRPVLLGRAPGAGAEPPRDPAALRRIAEALTALGAAQRKFVHVTEKKLAVIESTARPAGEETLTSLASELREGQQKLEARMGEFDVFLMRFDTALRDLSEKLAAMNQERRDAHTRVRILIAVALAVVASALAVFLLG